MTNASICKSGVLAALPSLDDGVWFFSAGGSLVFVGCLFLAVIYPDRMSLVVRQMIALVAALTSGMLAYFISGSLNLKGHLPLGAGADVDVNSAAGFAIFLVVLWKMWPKGTEVPEPPLSRREKLNKLSRKALERHCRWKRIPFSADDTKAQLVSRILRSENSPRRNR